MDTAEMGRRYDNPVRLSLTPPPQGAWDPEQLFVPEMQSQRLGKDGMFEAYDQHSQQRQAQVWSSTGPDRDRAALMHTAEKAAMQHYLSSGLAEGAHPTSVAALELRQDRMAHRRSLSQLTAYDRQHQHPMHDQGRQADLPASLDEKRQWAERDGRTLSHDERVSIGDQGGFNLFRHRMPEDRRQEQSVGQERTAQPAANQDVFNNQFVAAAARPNLGERLVQRQAERTAIQQQQQHVEKEQQREDAQAASLSGLSFMKRTQSQEGADLSSKATSQSNQPVQRRQPSAAWLSLNPPEEQKPASRPSGREPSAAWRSLPQLTPAEIQAQEQRSQSRSRGMGMGR